MATFNSANGHFQSGNKTLFEASVLATPDGSVVNQTNRLPVDIGTSTINISGNVNISTPNTVTVNSTPSDPVHVHMSEIGNNIILTDYVPIGGNVVVNNTVTISNGYVTTQNVSFSNQSVYLTTNVVAQVNNLPLTQNVSFSNQSVNLIGNVAGITANVVVSVNNFPASVNSFVYHSNGNVISKSDPLPIYLSSTPNLDNAPWDLQVSRGKVQGVTQINIFGYGNNVTNAGYTNLWEDGVYTFPATATTMNVSSTSASDAGGIVLINGLDSNFNMISETVTLTGTSNVTTTHAFLRVNSFQMTTPGTGQDTNIGTISMRNAANVALMYPGVGRMQNSWYTVPAGYSLYVRNINIFSGETKTGATPSWFYYRVRTHSNITNMHLNILTTSWQQEYKVQRNNPVRYTEKTDIEWQFSSSDGGPHAVGLILEGLLISDSAP